MGGGLDFEDRERRERRERMGNERGRRDSLKMTAVLTTMVWSK